MARRGLDAVRVAGVILAVLWAVNVGLLVGLFRAAVGGFDNDV